VTSLGEGDRSKNIIVPQYTTIPSIFSGPFHKLIPLFSQSHILSNIRCMFITVVGFLQSDYVCNISSRPIRITLSSSVTSRIRGVKTAQSTNLRNMFIMIVFRILIMVLMVTPLPYERGFMFLLFS
jgi:hypothetical protein